MNQTTPIHAFSSKDEAVNPYREIYEQYVDEASFLWVLRSIAVHQPHYSLVDIEELERRIEANLDGLMTSLDDAWDICEKALELQEPGETFTATIIAFRSLEMPKIQRAVEAGLSNNECCKGLISALGWLPGKLCHSWIKKFLGSKDLDHKYLAISACSVRRENPGEYLSKILQREDCLRHKKLHARSLRLIGELKRRDMVPALNAAVDSDNSEIAFWANWSSLLLGNKAAINRLEPYILQSGSNQRNAINLIFRALPVEQARLCVSALAKNEQQTRSVIKATGVLGDPHAVNWLITKMREPAFARLAGEAFTLITGIDLEQRQLANELPDLAEQLPNDDPNDSNIDMDEDENLPWPNVEKVAATWQQYGSHFQHGQRYFMGRTITPESLNHLIAKGLQRQRFAAALEQALISNVPLANTRARVFKGPV